MSDYWFEERFEAMFLSTHGHLSWVKDDECSLCGPLHTNDEEVDAR